MVLYGIPLYYFESDYSNTEVNFGQATFKRLEIYFDSTLGIPIWDRVLPVKGLKVRTLNWAGYCFIISFPETTEEWLSPL